MSAFESRKALVTGACGGIGRAFCAKLASEGFALALCGRDMAKLSELAADLSTRHGAQAECFVEDIGDEAGRRRLLAEASKALGGLDWIVCAHGSMPDEALLRSSSVDLEKSLSDNFVSAARLLELGAEAVAASPNPRLAAISSPAGLRGRGSNYAYGAGKAALSCWLSGLGHRLHGKIPVVELIPGFTRTPMTAGLPRSGPLWSDPEKVADLGFKAVAAGVPRAWLPGFWRAVMFIVCHLPTFALRRSKL